MANTGGPLDHLCSKHGLGAINITLPVMKMVSAHRPQTESDLFDLINSHNGKFCHSCKCKGKGTLKDWGKRMYDMQAEDEEWRKKNNFEESHPFDLDECVEWFRQLFVVAPMVGIVYENKACEELRKTLKSKFLIRHASAITDARCGVDLEIGNMIGTSGNRYRTQFHSLCGIQVKSTVYKNARHEVKEALKRRQRSYSAPVYFIYYNEQTGELDNFHQLIKTLKYRFPYMFP